MDTCGRFELGLNRKRRQPGRAVEVWIECRFDPWVRLVQGLAHAPPFLARQTDGRFLEKHLVNVNWEEITQATVVQLYLVGNLPGCCEQCEQSPLQGQLVLHTFNLRVAKLYGL